MSADQTTPTPAAGGPESSAEDRMTILQRRLAEIQAKSDQPAEAPAAAAIDPADAAPVERPAQGAEALPASQPEGAGTAEAEPETPAAAAPGSVAPELSPEAAAAQETAHHVPDSVTVDGHDLSAPAARAVAHYGTTTPTEAPAAPEAEAPTATSAEAITLTEAPAEAPAAEAPATASAVEETAEVPAMAADADDAAEAAPSAPVLEAPDFTGPDLPAQAAYLVQLLRAPGAKSNRKQIQDLTRLYETNVGLARSAARQKFAEGGNDAAAFAFQQPEGQQELNKAQQEFRQSRVQEAKAEDASRADNLTKKNALLDQLRTLVDSSETKDSSGKLKTLQAEWKATGAVPQADSQRIWDTYHGLLDIYYNNQGRFHEMRDLDRRRNLEAKEALIKRAEALHEAPGINKALDELTKLHEEWKTVGPVPNEQREPLWQRFLAASDVLHQRRKEFADQRGTVEKANLEVKKALLERILPFADFETDRVNLWRSKTDELQELKQEWDAAGLVPRAQADSLNKQYWAAYKAFFNRKNDFFKSLDSEKSTNLKAKTSLIEQVEEALNSPDWEAARNIVIRAQKEWKDIGRVPEKVADKLWNRFRTAADSFFDRPKQETRQREEKVSAASAEQIAHLDKLAEQVNVLAADNPGTLEGFRALLADWQTAFDPSEAHPDRSTTDRGEEQLISLLGKYLDHVPGLAYADRNDLLFQVEVGRLKARPQAQQQLTRKEMALRKEINELENDHATLQTNLDFFARSKNAAQLRSEYQGRMDEAQKRITVLKKQLKMIRS